MNTHEKFLSFNGKNIIFLNKYGQYWIAVKPICEALGVDYVRQFKNLKDNIILAPALSKQTMQIPSENGVLQKRELICIPPMKKKPNRRMNRVRFYNGTDKLLPKT